MDFQRKPWLRLPYLDNEIPIGSFRDFYAFEQHVVTCRKKRGLEVVPQWYEVPVFYFSNADSLIGDQAKVPMPYGCQELDYELELGLVIGKPGRDISIENAWDHVLGFTIVNDFSARDLQRQEMKVGLGPAKGKDFATAVGPEIISLETLKPLIKNDRLAVEMQAWVNDKRLSFGNAETMYYSWPQLIHRASQNVTLQPGDLLGSGTVGSGCILELGPENTGGWLKAGDVVKFQVEGIGELTNWIVTS